MSLIELCKLAYEQLPAECIVRAFGVEYVHLSPPEGGDLYLTRFGWPYAVQLLPENWFTDQWYAKKGEKLPGSTSQVYHVRSKVVDRKSADLVVKFSRVAQEVPLVVCTTFPDDVAQEIVAAARFNSPMEEFGLVMELRRGVYGATDKRVFTQRPLAIYAPPGEFKLWRLGRDESRFYRHSRSLAENQEQEIKAIELDIRRQYVLLYGWINGEDAEQATKAGNINQEELLQLSLRVTDETEQKGFRVLDQKPRHFILRNRRKDGKLMRRNGQDLSYSLIDFELLQRTPEHQRLFKIRQNQRYRKLQTSNKEISEIPSSSHVKQVNIIGIDYIFGPTQDGGFLWVVGRDPQLFDYFVPDRWRRTPRIKLSPHTEVYRTHTRDSINLVYRRSHVGSRPQVDPLSETGRRMRDHGYNSPFEIIAIAERLRCLGICTTHPRAIYRTSHKSTQGAYLRDPGRIESHANIIMPKGFEGCALLPDYDYYTIWDQFLGVELEKETDSRRSLDLRQAEESGILNSQEREAIIYQMENIMISSDHSDRFFPEIELSVYINEHDQLIRNSADQIETTACVDTLMAYELGLIDDETYRSLFKKLDARLHSADFEKLDHKGGHLLLTMDQNGLFHRDTDGTLKTTLCNMEFVRALYRPLL